MPTSIRRLFQLVQIILLVAGTWGTLPAQNVDGPLAIGELNTISSKVLGEDRPILVSLPDGYSGSTRAYPVLYVLDGRGNFPHATTTAQFLARNGRIPAVIVVGIPNTDRNRDFTPTRLADTANSGGADRFLDFMEKELIPAVESRFRTSSYRILAGHSLCGMFSMYTLSTRPGIFDAYIAISPYIMWDNNMPLKELAVCLEKPYPKPARLFMTLGNEPAYNNAIANMKELLDGKNAAAIQWDFQQFPDDTHGSVPLKSIYQGLEYIFNFWPLKQADIDRGIDGIKEHYATVSRIMGFTVQPPEAAVNAIGYQFIAANRPREAVEVLRFNTTIYPESANVYDSLGEALEAAGSLREALVNYRKAAEMGEAAKDRNTPIYQQHMKAAMQKLGTQTP